MSKSIFIPKKINVGYQNRSDTYTGKLAYVIYYDEKGKLRKEASWQSWRDDKIPNEEFENIPTEGFVLNKKVGDYDSGWNHRHAYCRIYDPRNFEFEITFENLLYILENTSSIKGKGLEGEFVYGWDGKDLVLIPVESPDYKELVKYNEILDSKEKIHKKDLIVGATYLDKSNTELVYIGCFDYYGTAYKWIEDGEEKISLKYNDIPREQGAYSWRKIDYGYVDDFNYGKHLWFGYKNTDNKWRILHYKTVSAAKLITCVDSNSHPEYADIFEELQTYSSYSPYDKSKDIKVKLTFEEFKDRTLVSYYKNHVKYTYFKGTFNGVDALYEIIPEDDENLNTTWTLKREDSNSKHYRDCKDDYEVFPYEIHMVKERDGYWATKDVEKKKMIPVSLEEIFNKLQPFYVQQYLQNGREYRKEYT